MVRKNGMCPERLLCIVASMDMGGAETFLMKIYRELDKTKYQMDFYVYSSKEGVYDKEILSMGGRIFYADPKSKKPLGYFIRLAKTVNKYRYRYVMRVSEHSLSTVDLIAAKIGGAEKLIFRSSNAQTGGGSINNLLHKIFILLSKNVPNIKLAPSTEAAEFMFGKDCIQRQGTFILKNAIPLEKFKFSQERREKIRKEFKIEEKFVIGHIGRFNEQKNHNFLVEVFYEISKKNEDSILLLVGEGRLENEIKMKINKLGITNKVIFTGLRSDVADIMMASDLIIFPSFFEGMPNVIIEAQATGLHCLVSDTITREANITGLVRYLSLDSGVSCWANTALEYRQDYTRKNTTEDYISNGYSIEHTVFKFIECIFKTREN
ncbi:glycosyltransferase family 1 protein [Turicibacter sanguinis]|uniref:glycosyltransferase family 1 protein n=1 Tax=Turicibacter sanguinis TaxID=154288 RepID=UPI0032EBC507